MFASIFNGIKARKQRKAAEKEQKNALQALDSQQTQLDNLFNSEYYGDYINRSDNQALLKNLRKQTQQLNQQTLTQSAVTGATPEAIAAQQKNNAETIGNTYSAIAANGAQWKNNVLNNYINHSAAINDKRYNTFVFQRTLIQHHTCKTTGSRQCTSVLQCCISSGPCRIICVPLRPK